MFSDLNQDNIGNNMKGVNRIVQIGINFQFEVKESIHILYCDVYCENIGRIQQNLEQ
jgi:hypothetical protein